MKHIDSSPIDNANLAPFLKCKDYTVSKEEFTILKDERHDFLITSPRPNDDDLAKYYESDTYISHTDSKKSLFDHLYQLVRNYTLNKKLKLINSFEHQERSILDIGAGTGDFLVSCQQDGWKVTGVEPNENAKNIAQEKLGKTLNSEFSSLTHHKFDVITMWHVLEHMPDINDTIETLKNLLKPDGTLVVAVPNHKSYDAGYYGKFWAAYDVPRHLWHFSQAAIRNLFALKAMHVTRILPMKFDAYYVSLLSEKYQTGGMKPLKAFLTGMRSNLKARRTGEYSSLIYIIKNR